MISRRVISDVRPECVSERESICMKYVSVSIPEMANGGEKLVVLFVLTIWRVRPRTVSSHRSSLCDLAALIRIHQHILIQLRVFLNRGWWLGRERDFSTGGSRSMVVDKEKPAVTRPPTDDEDDTPPPPPAVLLADAVFFGFFFVALLLVVVPFLLTVVVLTPFFPLAPLALVEAGFFSSSSLLAVIDVIGGFFFFFSFAGAVA